MRMIEVKLAKAVEAGIFTEAEAKAVLQIFYACKVCDLTEEQADAVSGLARHDYQEGTK